MKNRILQLLKKIPIVASLLVDFKRYHTIKDVLSQVEFWCKEHNRIGDLAYQALRRENLVEAKKLIQQARVAHRRSLRELERANPINANTREIANDLDQIRVNMIKRIDMQLAAQKRDQKGDEWKY